MPVQRIKRKTLNFSIEKPFQIKRLIKVLSITILPNLIIGGGFYFYTGQKIGDTYQMAHLKMNTFRDYLLPSILIFSDVVAFVTTVFTLFFPGKIAGPLYRTKKEMKKLGEGNNRWEKSLQFQKNSFDLQKKGKYLISGKMLGPSWSWGKIYTYPTKP